MEFDKETMEGLQKIAERENYELAALLAIIEVESNGVPWEIINGNREPIIRYEGHYFDKLCDPRIRGAARIAGVSSPKAGGVKNPASQVNRWKLVQKAANYDPAAAYMSCSYGVGQVMGSHWKSLGFKSLEEFLKTVRSGLEGQVEVMVRFIRVNKLDKELRDLDWSGFAAGYNGKNYAKNKYDTKMAAAYKRHGGCGSIPNTRSGNLRLGSQGAGVRDVQAMLVLSGYDVVIDGFFGKATKQAVQEFQKANKLIPDGIVGPKTQQAFTNVRDTAPSDAGQERISQIPEVKQGVGTAVVVPTVITATKTELDKAITSISQFPFLAPLADFLHSVVGVVTVAIIIIGLSYAGYGYIKSKRSRTGTTRELISNFNIRGGEEFQLPKEIRI